MPWSTSSTSFNYWDDPLVRASFGADRKPKFNVGDICETILSYVDNIYPPIGRVVRIRETSGRVGGEPNYHVEWFVDGGWKKYPPERTGDLVLESALKLYEYKFEHTLPKGDVFVIPKRKVISVKDEQISVCEPMVQEFKEGELPLPAVKFKKVKVFTVEA